MSRPQVLPLIAGEDPDGALPEDVAGWVRIYGELATLYGNLLERTLDDGAARARTNALIGLQARTNSRLAIWQERYRELVGVELDMAGPMLRCGGRTAHLTRREAELLGFLLEHPGRRYRARALAGMAWGDFRLCPEQIRTYVGRLRRRLSAVGAPLGISTARRDGYALVREPGTP